MTRKTILSLKNIKRAFGTDDAELLIFEDLNIEIKQGELVALVGQSGSGKSSLLHIAGLLDTPNKGEIIINDAHCNDLTDAQRTEIRRHEIGFIYQFHHLLPEFTALENVAVPLRLNGNNKADAHKQAAEILHTLGMGPRLTHFPAELSGGEQQRVAIARAFAINPSLILADEPTGNLDPATADHVYDEFYKLAREQNMSALIATHNMDLAAKMDRVFILENGQLVEK
ncbi:MAG: ABC transporter ATP-binding protein [OCS116 cluster bacterium]|uniref:ABC transporter n=1 Tax=OCS116 cluster bacterium TaxID=2030921 RepID=A0A2A4Z4M6_9PROT|nr:ABC transporter ATP-binding protein [OCS116 cluster bacterium]